MRRVLFLALLAEMSLLSTARAEDSAPSRPRLVVLVVVDQLRGDYLERWQTLYGEKGFRRLMKDGAWFANCHYPYAGTLTGAGHASVATGCSPETHGIVGNDWFDPKRREEANCVDHGDHARVPLLPKDIKTTKKPVSVSPENLLAPTVADALKAQSQGKGKVVALSIKDRSAVLPGGRKPDLCLWYDTQDGQFVTSTYYRPQLPPWVMRFNEMRPADRWFDRDWVKLKPSLTYGDHSGPDDVEAEGKGSEQGRTFPHPTTGGLKAPGKAFYEAVTNSPYGNELLLRLAKMAIRSERLGADEVPDFLSVSFSSNDLVGHVYGPDSQEVLDITLRTDLAIEELLRYLDTEVGEGKYLLALTADHGVCPIPEVRRAQGKTDAGRLLPKEFALRVNDFLNKKHGKEGEKAALWVLDVSNGWITLDEDEVKDRGLKLADVQASLVDWLRGQPEIQAAYTQKEVADGPGEDSLLAKVRLSYHPERSGHVIAVFKPYFILWSYLTGTTHGSPYDYDTHVPLLVYGPGVRPGKRADRVTPLAVAPILSRGLGVREPAKCSARVPDRLFGQ